MSNYNEPAAAASRRRRRPRHSGRTRSFRPAAESPRRVGTVVWGLIVCALAALIIIAGLGIVALNGTYVLLGLMIGAGAALVIGGILSARARDKNPATRKS